MQTPIRPPSLKKDNQEMHAAVLSIVFPNGGSAEKVVYSAPMRLRRRDHKFGHLPFAYACNSRG